MSNVDTRIKDMFDAQRMKTFEETTDYALSEGGGGGRSGGMTGDWKADVNRQLMQLHGDVRSLLYGLIGGAVFIVGGGAAAYVGLSSQIAESRKDVTAIQIQQSKTEAKIDLLVERSVLPAK